jgi:hypothetical protein
LLDQAVAAEVPEFGGQIFRVGLVFAMAFTSPQRDRRNEGQQSSKAIRSLKSAALRLLLARSDPKRDILSVLNLEDTPKHLAPFAIEGSRGVLLKSVVSVRGIPL